MHISETDLKKYLLGEEIISQEDFDEAVQDAKTHNVSLSHSLVHAGKIPERTLQQAIAHITDTPFVDLVELKIDDAVLARIPEPLARKHNVVAFKETDGALHVAVPDTDLLVLDRLRKANTLEIVPHLSDTASIQAALKQYRKSLNVEFDKIIREQVGAVGADVTTQSEKTSPEELERMAQDLPIIKIVDTLITHAIVQNASDVHIEPEENSLIVRYRIDGILHDVMQLPQKITAGVLVRIKVLANLRLDEKRLPQDGRFKTTVDNQEVSFRVSTLPTYFGEKIVIRILKESAHGFSLEALGFHGEALEHVHSAMTQKTGLILVSGPTGSGKTTTLYTMLDILNTTDVNISTVEDPIEYQVDRINQTQVRSDIGLTFAAGLRSLLRQDPDILMVGEIRDKETVSLAVNAALTGHLVLSTIHTNSAAGVIPRMADMGIETFLIVSTIKTITAQRLVRVLCDDKEEYFLTTKELEELREVVDMDRVLEALKKEKIVSAKATWKEIPFYKPTPSPEHETGYSGRIGIHEALHMSDPMKQLIVKGATATEIEELAKSEGMLTMIEDGIFKAVQGITTTEEVLRVISD